MNMNIFSINYMKSLSNFKFKTLDTALKNKDQ